MPLFIPVVLIGAGVVSGAGGAANLVRGVQKMRQAGSEAARAKSRYEAELEETEAAVEATNAVVQANGEQQEASLRLVVHRMAEFLRRHHQTVAERASDLLDGVVVDQQLLDKFCGGRISLDGLAGQIASTALAGAATYSGVPLAVTAYGSASTGTAIAGLSGAAAQNATLAWLGGGSIAAGGGGMALGAMALNFVTIGPAMLVGGFVLNGKGEKALTDARRYCADVDRATGEQHKLRKRLDLVDLRVQELATVLGDLTERAVAAMDHLEANEPFDPQIHAEPFRRGLAYAIAVRDIVSTPVLGAHGELDPATERLVITYRGMQ